MQIWQLFIVLRKPVDLSVTVFSNPTKLTNIYIHALQCLFHYMLIIIKQGLILRGNHVTSWSARLILSMQGWCEYCIRSANFTSRSIQSNFTCFGTKALLQNIVRIICLVVGLISSAYRLHFSSVVVSRLNFSPIGIDGWCCRRPNCCAFLHAPFPVMS